MGILILIAMVVIIFSPLLYKNRAEYYKIKQYGIDMHASVNQYYGHRPYSYHLKKVHSYAKKYIYLLGNIDVRLKDFILAACWVHDVIEDCRQTYNDVKDYCGYIVAEIVFALSNEKGKTRKERASKKYYDDMKKIDYASFLKLCDRLANIEYSLESKGSMINAYKREHTEFRANLYDVRFKPMFDEMEEMMYGKK